MKRIWIAGGRRFVAAPLADGLVVDGAERALHPVDWCGCGLTGLTGAELAA